MGFLNIFLKIFEKKLRFFKGLLGAALTLAETGIFEPMQNQSRADAKSVVIVVTDGASSDDVRAPSQS